MAESSPILIIGAGAAGLYAGYELQKRGLDFRILEASDRLGGRLAKLEGFADYPLDLGAEWLHGKKSIMGKLVKATQTAIKKDKSNVRYWYQNQLVKKTPIDVWDFFEKRNLPDVSYQDLAIRKGFWDNHQFIVEAVAGDFGSAAAHLSAYWKVEEEWEWHAGNKDYRFAESYAAFFHQHITAAILNQVQLQTAIVHIDYGGDHIRLTDTGGRVYQTEKLILTVPISILKAGDITFSPPLPEEKMAAFQQIGMDPGMKVFLKFSDTFFHENIIGGQVCGAYVDESYGKRGKDHVLMAFVMGSQAKALSDLESDQAIVQKLLQELDDMYAGQASRLFIDAYVMNWTKHPFIRGAYSYSTPGMGNARSIAAQPVAGKLFFAGEAMNLNGHHQTVHGAVETALLAVAWALGGF